MVCFDPLGWASSGDTTRYCMFGKSGHDAREEQRSVGVVRDDCVGGDDGNIG